MLKYLHALLHITTSETDLDQLFLGDPNIFGGPLVFNLHSILMIFSNLKLLLHNPPPSPSPSSISLPNRAYSGLMLETLIIVLIILLYPLLYMNHCSDMALVEPLFYVTHCSGMAW